MVRWALDLLRIPSLSSFPRNLRQLEQDVETVINVLQPGPLGIVEHRFSSTEIQEAKATVERAVANWQRNTALERVQSVTM